MTKPASTRVTRRAPTPLPPAPAPEPAPAPLALMDAPDPHEQLESLLEQFGGGTDELTINVERKKGSRGMIGHLGTIEFDSELFDRVKELYGGGDYRGRVNVNGKYRRSINFTIAGAPRDPDADTGATQESAPLSKLETILTSVLEGQRALLETMKNPPREQGSRLGEFKEIAEVMKAMMPAAPAAVAPVAPVSPLAALNEMLELQARLDERAPRGGGNGVDWSPVIEHGVKPLIGVIDKKLELDREAMNRRRPIAVVQPADAPVAPLPSPETMTLESLAAHVPRPARAYLLDCAQRDKSPELYAELVLDQLPGDVVDRLPALLAPDDAAARLVAAVPEWAAYGAWFGELVDSIRASLAAPADGETE